MLELLMAMTSRGRSAGRAGFSFADPGEPALSVHHEPGPGPSVLYVHGATFPAALSMNYRMEGKSWADDLHARGLDVWSFDFAGYGGSDHPAVMELASVPRDKVPGRAADAVHQIARVVRYIRAVDSITGRYRLLRIRGGPSPPGLFTGTHAGWVDKLVLFGPVAKREDTISKLRPWPRPTSSRLGPAMESFQSPIPDNRADPDFEDAVSTPGRRPISPAILPAPSGHRRVRRFPPGLSLTSRRLERTFPL